jgi:hypothetical protein
VDREADAVAQFEQIVRADEEQRIQAPTFSAQVVAIFDRVRRRVRGELEAERDAAREAEEARRQTEIRLLMENREALEELRDLASVSEVHEPNSRLIASLPFGVGQFQNEKVGLGAFFLTSEVVFGAGAIITYIAWATLGANEPPGTIDASAFSTQEQILRISNQTLFALFGATLVAGIIEAHVNFRPERVIRQRREIPADLLPREPEPEVDVSLSPFGASLRVTF